jgi:hypothetical protein
VRIDRFDEVRELEPCARRQVEKRHALLATSELPWDELCTKGRPSLGVSQEDAGEIDLNLRHPELRGIDRADLAHGIATCGSAAVVARG